MISKLIQKKKCVNDENELTKMNKCKGVNVNEKMQNKGWEEWVIANDKWINVDELLQMI